MWLQIAEAWKEPNLLVQSLPVRHEKYNKLMKGDKPELSDRQMESL